MRALALVLSLAIAAPGVVLATPSADDLALARERFRQGVEQEEQGDWSAALAIFREVASLVEKPNHIVRFHLALCLENTGKLVDAMAQFAIAKSTAEREGGTDADLTIANAVKHIDALRARIPSVRIEAQQGAVWIDGAPIERALLATPLPLDPGEHRVEVRAEGKKPWSTRVTLVDGQTAPVPVTAVLEPLPAVVVPPPQPKESPSERSFAPAWGAIGISVGALAGAGVFALLRGSTLAELDAACDASRAACDPRKRSLESQGKTYTIATDVLLGVGAVAAGAAIVLFTTGKSSTVTAGVGPASFTVAARF